MSTNPENTSVMVPSARQKHPEGPYLHRDKRTYAATCDRRSLRKMMATIVKDYPGLLSKNRDRVDSRENVTRKRVKYICAGFVKHNYFEERAPQLSQHQDIFDAIVAFDTNAELVLRWSSNRDRMMWPIDRQMSEVKKAERALSSLVLTRFPHLLALGRNIDRRVRRLEIRQSTLEGKAVFPKDYSEYVGSFPRPSPEVREALKAPILPLWTRGG